MCLEYFIPLQTQINEFKATIPYMAVCFRVHRAPPYNYGTQPSEQPQGMYSQTQLNFNLKKKSSQFIFAYVMFQDIYSISERPLWYRERPDNMGGKNLESHMKCNQYFHISAENVQIYTEFIKQYMQHYGIAIGEKEGRLYLFPLKHPISVV